MAARRYLRARRLKAWLLEFPTFEEAKAWYDSPAYRKVREHRYKGADYRAVIVQGE